jgi:uncharacterized protein YggT (Ycf19 family)
MFRTSQVIWSVLGMIEITLIFRFALKFLGANPFAQFSAFVYSISLPLASPFLTVFQVSNTPDGTFEWTTLLAMFVYWLIATGLMRLMIMSKPISSPDAADKLEREEII